MMHVLQFEPHLHDDEGVWGNPVVPNLLKREFKPRDSRECTAYGYHLPNYQKGQTAHFSVIRGFDQAVRPSVFLTVSR